MRCANTVPAQTAVFAADSTVTRPSNNDNLMQSSHEINRIKILIGTCGFSVLTAFNAAAAPLDAAANDKAQMAMSQHFATGDYSKAEAILLGTIKACEDKCDASVKASLWIYIGIARVARHDASQNALNAFTQALTLDPSVRLDMTYADQNAVLVYKQARSKISTSTQEAPAEPTQAPQASALTPQAATAVPATASEQKTVQQPAAAAPVNAGVPSNAPTVQAPARAAPVNAGGPSTLPRAQTSTAPTPAPAGVPITFEKPARSEAYTIRATQAGKTQSCVTPCALNLQPGIANVEVAGERHFFWNLAVPSSPSRVSISFERKGQTLGGRIVEASGLLIVSIEGIQQVSASQPLGQSLGIIAVGALVFTVGAILAGTSGTDKLETKPSSRTAVALKAIGVAPVPHGGGVVGASFAF